jgi:hypothetical protein
MFPEARFPAHGGLGNRASGYADFSETQGPREQEEGPESKTPAPALCSFLAGIRLLLSPLHAVADSPPILCWIPVL